MIVSLLVAEVVLLLLVVVVRWVDIAPFNDVATARKLPFAQRVRDTLFEAAPVAVALAFTAVRLAPEAAAMSALGLVPVAALSLSVAATAKAKWVPWWQGARAPVRNNDEVHAFLEPRRAGAMVPSTFECLVHAHAAACVLMALVALVGVE